ncbi:alpha/beta hydrolase [Streptomyces sp. NPDC097610]|uniref:alpha/beta fold hydrolase n=1 Tax=Streptomyces sp. NPDC097610 TaxID=3157227 RepID=UPI00331E7B43
MHSASGPPSVPVAAVRIAGRDRQETDVGAHLRAQPLDPARPGPDALPSTPQRRRPWVKRWLRRLALGCAVLLAVVTTASFIYNACTAHRAAPPKGLRYVQAADIRTRYRTWGTSGSPVVLVHGAFEQVDTWSRLAPLLARDHRVYALDLTGDGYSQRRGPYTVGHFTQQLLGFLDAMHLGGPGARPLLVGHSSGAAVVAQAALRAPGRIGGVMLLDGDALDTGAGPPPALKYVLLDPYRTSLLRLALSGDRLIRSVYDTQCGPTCPPLDAAGVDQWRRPLQVPGAEAALWSMLGQGVPGLPAHEVARLAALHIPKSVVFGAQDDVFSSQTPQQTARRIGAPTPTLIPRARHLTMISNPRDVATAVEALATRTT